MASLFSKSFDSADSDCVEKKESNANTANNGNHLRARSLDSMDKSHQDANRCVFIL